MFTKIGRKALAMFSALTFVVMSATASLAGPTSIITVKNNWSEKATVASNTGCVGSVTPGFSEINSGSSQVNSVQAAYDTVFSCRVKYRRGNFGPTCDFVISRLVKVNIFGSYWQYPKVVVYEGSGVDCSYTFTSVQDTGDAPTGSNGNFNVTLEMK